MQSAKTKPKPRLESDLAYVVSFCTFFYLILNEFLHFSAFFCIFVFPEVKLRGQRVELGEVEETLLSAPAVTEAGF